MGLWMSSDDGKSMAKSIAKSGGTRRQVKNTKTPLDLLYSTLLYFTATAILGGWEWVSG